MDNSKQAGMGIGQSCPPPRGLLEQIDFQIQIHEKQLSQLKLLRFKLGADPELEFAIRDARYLLN